MKVTQVEDRHFHFVPVSVSYRLSGSTAADSFQTLPKHYRGDLQSFGRSAAVRRFAERDRFSPHASAWKSQLDVFADSLEYCSGPASPSVLLCGRFLSRQNAVKPTNASENSATATVRPNGRMSNWERSARFTKYCQNQGLGPTRRRPRKDKKLRQHCHYESMQIIPPYCAPPCVAPLSCAGGRDILRGFLTVRGESLGVQGAGRTGGECARVTNWSYG